MFRSAMHVVVAADIALLTVALAIIVLEEVHWRRKQAVKGPISAAGRTTHVE